MTKYFAFIFITLFFCSSLSVLAMDIVHTGNGWRALYDSVTGLTRIEITNPNYDLAEVAKYIIEQDFYKKKEFYKFVVSGRPLLESGLATQEEASNAADRVVSFLRHIRALEEAEKRMQVIEKSAAAAATAKRETSFLGRFARNKLGRFLGLGGKVLVPIGYYYTAKEIQEAMKLKSQPNPYSIILPPEKEKFILQPWAQALFGGLNYRATNDGQIQYYDRVSKSWITVANPDRAQQIKKQLEEQQKKFH